MYQMIINVGCMVKYYVVDGFLQLKDKYALWKGDHGLIYGNYLTQPLVTYFM